MVLKVRRHGTNTILSKQVYDKVNVVALNLEKDWANRHTSTFRMDFEYALLKWWERWAAMTTATYTIAPINGLCPNHGCSMSLLRHL